MEQGNEINVETVQSEDVKLMKRLAQIKHKIIIMSGKGGVGKSTVATNLAMSLAMRGYETGILDVDITGPNVPKMLGVEDAPLMADDEGIFPVEVTPHLKAISMAFLISDKDAPVVWRGPAKMGAIRQFLTDVNWGKLDYLVIDLPPGTGDEPLSIAQLIPEADGAVIVTTPQDVALLDSRKSVMFAKKLGLPVLGVIENMSGFKCPHCGERIDLFKMGGGEKAAKDLGVPFLGRIPIDMAMVPAGDDGRPVVLGAPESEGAVAFQLIADKLKETVESLPPRKPVKR
ncbi:MAG: Mrp/NBP35 family ATP-binding protein [Euryarchaeota archaeon]|nr:Mrp/NBP35 family ATP-binding protein [Euryarchaeota archaeon]